MDRAGTTIMLAIGSSDSETALLHPTYQVVDKACEIAGIKGFPDLRAKIYREEVYVWRV